jgi:hypothetical protein
MGFTERDSNEVREWITVEGEILTSKVNGASYQAGRLEIASLGEFRKSLSSQQLSIGKSGSEKKSKAGDASVSTSTERLQSRWKVANERVVQSRD